MSKPKAYIFDIDGTLADTSHRNHFLEKSPKNWDGWNAAMADDGVHQHIARITLMIDDGEIFLVTGRELVHSQVTREWLRKNRILYDALYMRPTGDRRHDWEIKQEHLAKIREDYDVVMAFEDRQQVVDMWRRNGVPCAQVAPGDF